MGGSASRIWNDICAIESDQVRAAMIERVVQSPELRSAAQQYGVYETVVQWLMARRHGRQMPWPYQYKTVATAATPTAAVQDPRLAMWQIPTATTATASTTSMIVSPAAKAMDYFQEALELLGIHDSEELTAELLKTAYRRVALRVHPDKAGGSKEAFDAVKQAYDYVLRILQRINPRFSPAEEARMTGPVTAETAAAYRSATAPPALPDTPPVALSAKKLDMGVFNRLFEENRLPDPSRDTGYGDWMKEDNKVPAGAAAAAAAEAEAHASGRGRRCAKASASAWPTGGLRSCSGSWVTSLSCRERSSTLARRRSPSAATRWTTAARCGCRAATVASARRRTSKIGSAVATPWPRSWSSGASSASCRPRPSTPAARR